jgi:hypothetical protein
MNQPRFYEGHETSTRRLFLFRAAVLAAAACAPGAARAMTPGMRLLTRQGRVFINGKPAEVGAQVESGDLVRTGPGATASFVIGEDAYMLRGETEIVVGVPSESGYEDAVRLLTGAFIGAFAPGERKRIETPTASTGIRGTAVYAAVEPGRTYLCTCYGETETVPASNPDAAPERVVSTNHEARYVYWTPRHGGAYTEPGPFKGHRTREVVAADKMAGRASPLAGKPEPGGE